MLATPTQTPQRRCKSCGQEGHCRSSAKKCPNYRPAQKKARLEEIIDSSEPAIEIEAEESESDEGNDSDVESDDSEEADVTFVADVSDDEAEAEEPVEEPAVEEHVDERAAESTADAECMWWNAQYTPRTPPPMDDVDHGFDQFQVTYNPYLYSRSYIHSDIVAPGETLESFLDAHRIQKGDLCSHTAMDGWKGGAWFIPKVLDKTFLVLFFRDSIMAQKPIPMTEKFLRGCDFWYFVDWEMSSQEMYNDFLAKNCLEDLAFLQRFASLCDFPRPASYSRAKILFSRNPKNPHKIHINYPGTAVTSDDAKRVCAELQGRFQAAFVSDDPAWNWNKIFDKGPYGNGGLRILGACKEGQRSGYQILDLHSGQYEPLHIQQLLATSIRLEYRSDAASPLYGSIGTVSSEHELLVKQYVSELKAANVFPTQTLGVVGVKSGFDGRSFVVDLSDDYCPYTGRAHSRTSHYMYLFLTRFGCWLKCYDEDCRERHEHHCKDLPAYIREMFDGVEQELDPEGVKSIVKQEWANGDKGIAKIVHHFLHKNAMYSTSTKSLYHYSEARCLWEIVTQNEFKWTMSDTIEKALRPLVKKYVDDAANEPDKKKKEMLDQWASDVLGIIKKYSSTRALSLLYPLFEGIVTYPDVESKFDKIPHLLGVRNGVIDLRTGELRNRTREDGIFRVSPIVYDPEADVSFIEDMYSAIMADDEEMKRFLQLCLGYVITGETKEEIVLVFTGVGRNGKGGTIQTIKKIMGAFMATLNNGLILKRKGGNGGNMDAERGRFRGIRIALFNEIGDGEVLNTAELQMYSGRDGISINEKYMTPTEIENPSHKCIITTNWSPTIPMKELTASIIERLIILDFPVTFTDLLGEEPTIHRRQVVRELKDDLEKKLHVFLKWIVLGAVAYYQEGGGLKAKSPQKVKKSTAAYFEKQDSVRKFVDQECIRGDTGEFSEEVNSFFAQFQEFDNKVDKTNFVFGLTQLGITSKQVRIPGTKFRQSRYFGVRLRPVESLEEGVRDDAEPVVPVI